MGSETGMVLKRELHAYYKLIIYCFIIIIIINTLQ